MPVRNKVEASHGRIEPQANSKPESNSQPQKNITEKTSF